MSKGIPSWIYIAITAVISLSFLGILIASQSGKLTAREEDLVALAEKIGLNKDEFTTKFRDQTLRDSVINADKTAQNEKGITGTPTLMINGTVTNARTSEALESEIDTLVASGATLPVTIEEYFDFQCSACRDFHDDIVQIKKDLADKATITEVPVFLSIFNVEKGKQYSYAYQAAVQMGKGEQMAAEIYFYEHKAAYPYEQVKALIAE